MKVLLCPVNMAGQPMELTKELRKQGVDAHFLQYKPHKFGYESDKIIHFNSNNRGDVQLTTVEQTLKEDYDIYHFWFRTLLYGRLYQDMMGLDLPFIKSRGKKVIYRFTGNDLRYKSTHIKKDPYSFFKYEFNSKINERWQRRYIDFLQHYVDEFVVQDPEMHGYLPIAKMIPRAMDLSKLAFVGIKKTSRPLVVHVPSIPAIKGTTFVQKAVKELKKEGLAFDYKEVSGITHTEAVNLYKRADIVIDELLIGWYGILALECMAMGKPVMAYIRKDLINSMGEEIPIENVNIDNIKGKLKVMINDYNRRLLLSKKGRPFVEKHHNVTKVATQLHQLYQSVMNNNRSITNNRPDSFADVRFFKEHYKMLYNELQSKTTRIRQLEREIQQLKKNRKK